MSGCERVTEVGTIRPGPQEDSPKGQKDRGKRQHHGTGKTRVLRKAAIYGRSGIENVPDGPRSEDDAGGHGAEPGDSLQDVEGSPQRGTWGGPMRHDRRRQPLV